MNIVFLSGGIFWIVIAILYSYYEGSKRKAGFVGSLIILILFSPLFGYFIIESFAQKKAKGCRWCGNKYNEAEYCGLCGKNVEGVIREGFIEK